MQHLPDLTPTEVKAFRASQGMTQSELANAIGLSVKAVQKWELQGAPQIWRDRFIQLRKDLDEEKVKSAIRELGPKVKEQLLRFQSVNSFSATVDAFSDEFGEFGYLLLDTAQSFPYRDAWLASRFAQMRKADAVRLGDEPPDFYLQIDGRKIGYEAVEVIKPHRQRRNELREVYKGPVADPASSWLTIQEVLNLIKQEVDKKADKKRNDPKYEKVNSLLVYANTGFVEGPGSLAENIQSVFENAMDLEFGDHGFEEIWLAKSTYCERIA